MKRSCLGRFSISITPIAVGWVLQSIVPAAVVSPVFTETFDGGLNALLTSRGSPSISGGIANLNGVAHNDGFTFDLSSYNSIATPKGPTVSFIMEVRLSNEAFSSPENLDTLMSFNGFIGIRYLSGNWGVYTQAGDKAITIAPGDDLALVYDKIANSLEFYRNHADATPAGLSNFSTQTSTNNLGGFGLEVDSTAPAFTRGFNGGFDAIAFATFTGTFNPSSDFLLVPEPAGLAFLALGGMTLLRRARRNVPRP